MYTVRDVAEAVQREPNAVYRAIKIVEIYRKYRFRKEGRAFLFNEQEKQLLEEVVTHGVAAAKPTTEFKNSKEVIM